jgi:hypothetical protein
MVSLKREGSRVINGGISVNTEEADIFVMSVAQTNVNMAITNKIVVNVV